MDIYNKLVPTGKNNRRDIDQIYKLLSHELRSTIQEHTESAHSKCLVRFHNCTPYKISPYWLDFQGDPIKYPDLPRGAFINIDTFKSHLWFFKADDSNSSTSGRGPIRILALPEESLSRTLPFMNLDPMQNKIAVGESLYRTVRDSILGLNNSLICSLCRYILKNYSIGPTKVPCPHFTGETKFSVSDIDVLNYIYHCGSSEHCEEHSKQRRNIYLVEPFISLRERCFLALRKQIRSSTIVDLNLPLSLEHEYLEYITTLKKMNGQDED